MTDNELCSRGAPDTLDNSRRSDFEKCPRLYYWLERGFIPVHEPGYFIFGRVWGDTIATYHLTGDIQAAQVKLIESWNTATNDPGEDPNSKASCWRLFELYAEAYPQPEQWHLIALPEQGFRWPIRETPYYYAGALDGYIEWPGYGLLVLENKTTGMYLGDKYMDQWSFSSQVTGYIWMLSQLLEGEQDKIFGCLMNVASKKLPKTKTPALSSLFMRSLERRSIGQLQTFILDVLDSFKRLERCWDNWYFPRTTDPRNCVGSIGLSPCMFRFACRDDRDYRLVDPRELGDGSSITLRDKPWQPWQRSGSDAD